MSGFAISLFSLAVLFSVACALIYDRRFVRVERFLFSVIFTSVLFSSLFSALTDGPLSQPTLPDGAVGEESTFDEMMAQAVQRGTEEALRSAFSLAEDELILTVSEVDTKSHLPTSVSVVLYGRGTLKDTRAMEQYLKEKGGFRNVNISIHLGA